MILLACGGRTRQGWPHVFDPALAFVLSAAIGLEREALKKSAGLRTHTLVEFGTGAG
jgi:putative Mg2+ transporter-C (MgtC) family protein